MFKDLKKRIIERLFGERCIRCGDVWYPYGCKHKKAHLFALIVGKKMIEKKMKENDAFSIVSGIPQFELEIIDKKVKVLREKIKQLKKMLVDLSADTTGLSFTNIELLHVFINVVITQLIKDFDENTKIKILEGVMNGFKESKEFSKIIDNIKNMNEKL